jgi:Tfp pilus assembly protein PilO
MRLHHFIVVVICAAALGVATVWYEVQNVQIGYEMEHLRAKNEELRKSVENKDVELATMPELDSKNLEKLNEQYDLGLKPPGR